MTSKTRYELTIGLGEEINMFDRASPETAIKAWLKGQMKQPTCCEITSDKAGAEALAAWCNKHRDKLYSLALHLQNVQSAFYIAYRSDYEPDNRVFVAKEDYPGSDKYYVHPFTMG